MDIVSVAAVAVASLSTLLLVVALVQIRSLRRDVAELATPRGRAAPSTGRDDQLLLAIRDQVRDLEAQIDKFDIVFSDIRSELNSLQHQGRAIVRLVSEPADPGAARPEPEVRPGSRGDSAGWSSAGESARTGGPPSAPPPPAADPASRPFTSAPAPDSSAAGGLDSLLEQYRELIAQPRKNEINRWSDDIGGTACEVTEDGTVKPLSRDEGGLLVLVTKDGVNGAVVPGGRLVVDFPTSFSNVISMRSVTRHSFELEADGSGILRLVEPALVTRAGDRWQLVRAGTIAGLKSD
jgi:hypothetical protein